MSYLWIVTNLNAAVIDAVMKDATNPYLILDVRREHIVEDTLAQVAVNIKVSDLD